MVTVMTLSAMGDPIDIQLVQREMRKNRIRKLTDDEINSIWDDLKEEVLNGKAVYEEMMNKFNENSDVYKRFSGI
jgi:archaellum component FlaC